MNQRQREDLCGTVVPPAPAPTMKPHRDCCCADCWAVNEASWAERDPAWYREVYAELQPAGAICVLLPVENGSSKK